MIVMGSLSGSAQGRFQGMPSTWVTVIPEADRYCGWRHHHRNVGAPGIQERAKHA